MCGKDSVSSRSYDHRRHQIEHDLLRLASIFYIDVAAFAVLSNHYHVVLHVDRDSANSVSAKDVVRRWHHVFKPKDVSQKFINGEHLESHELNQIDVLIDTWRKRLYDISWLMKVLNVLKLRMQQGKEAKARRGKLYYTTATGYVRDGTTLQSIPITNLKLILGVPIGSTTKRPYTLRFS